MKLKKLASVMLALVMALALAMPALATEANGEGDTSSTTQTDSSGNTGSGSTGVTTPKMYTITGPGNNHTYEIYQIFTGELSEGNVLSNVKWGKNGTGTEGEPVGKAILDELVAKVNSNNDAEKLAVIEKYVKLDSSNKFETVAGGAKVDVPAGYYLIRDVVDKDKPLGEGDAYTSYIVEIVANVTISPKSGTTQVEKKVQDINDSDTNPTHTNWQDSADYDIGDTVPFQLKATLAENVSAYDEYAVKFIDTLSAGLTYNGDAKVYIVTGEKKAEVTNNFKISSDVKEENGTKTTTLTISCDDVKVLKAADGSAVGNGSVITVEYTATLNSGAVIGIAGNPNEVELEYSNNPNGEGTGKTPKDKVIVFTYQVVINKVDQDKKPLTGAQFTLAKKINGVYEEIAKLPADPGEGEELEAMSTFTFEGLDDGDYRLTESRTPTGYNSIDPIEFTITAEHEIESDNPVLKSLTGTETLSDPDASGLLELTPAVADGSLTSDILNQKGVVLPETGGIGTTIFYVVGGVLVLAAVVFLITKRRMS